MHRNRKRRCLLKFAAGAALLTGSLARESQAGALAMSPDQTMRKLGFDAYTFDDDSYRHLVYVKGTGPSVIVMHELPGFDEHTVHFLDRLTAAGFRVHAPHLFGAPMWSDSTLNYARLCISKEFAYLKSNRSAPVCDWLRGLARSVSADNADGRVGVIGMCLTGAFVIPMVIEPGVRAAVISQPAIPTSPAYILTGSGEGEWMRDMNVSDADLEAATRRCAADNVPLIVQRFKNDRVSPHARVVRIAEAFGNNATLYEYDNPGPKPHPHALLTYEYDAAEDVATNPTRVALERVTVFLRENLLARTA
ncbi:dienelactone hydrolase family protein [Caballeronia sp. dw_276]|uniref:dienelactone hydrolase family protein n=1 Tax=Caballeronia sp. dw_276 TaxID=2719795 RepID=UPI001BD69371|nr:dienelactone hydrolase family protein [Caballeronia sp. dw_276]